MAFVLNFFEKASALSVIDSRSSALSVSGGSVDSGGTTVNFSSSVSGSFVGEKIVFTSGSNSGLGDVIASESPGSGSVNSVVLPSILPNAPASGDEFVLLSKTNSTSRSPILTVNRSIQLLTFSSDVAKGFDTLGARFFATKSHADNLLGSEVLLSDTSGDAVWEGVVTGVEYDDNAISVEASGYSATFDWYYYSGAIGAVTSPDALRTISGSNPYLYTTALGGIDRGDVLKTAQTGGAEISPVDFSESSVLASDAVNAILAYGNTPIDNDSLVLQVWYNRTPVTQVIKREPSVKDAKWMISRSTNANLKLGSASLALPVNLLHADYTTENGDSLRSYSAADLMSLLRFGPKEKAITVGAEDEASIGLVIGAFLESRRSAYSSPSIDVSGYVERNTSGLRVPVYKIRAGDIVAFFDQSLVFPVPQNSLSFGRAGVVSSVTYSMKDDTASISIYSPESLVEKQLDIIDIDSESLV